MWLVSNMDNHKLDPEVSKEDFKKFANSTGLLICIEDIKKFKKLSQILAWQYDDNMTYRNKEVSFNNIWAVQLWLHNFCFIYREATNQKESVWLPVTLSMWMSVTVTGLLG